MNRIEAIAGLKRNADAIRARGATALYMFGSIARNEGRPDSDLDLFVEYDPAKKFSLLDLAAIKNLIEDRLAISADVTTRDSLHPMLREDIERSAIRVF